MRHSVNNSTLETKETKLDLGFGLGLRTEHYSTILDTHPPIDWFEIISENFMISGGQPFYYLDSIRERYPMTMHGVSLSIGSADPLDRNYLKQLKKLIKRVDPIMVSDHLCWTGVNGLNMHDLLPLPYTEEAIKHVSKKLNQAQDILGCTLMLENVSSYITYTSSTMTEWEFLNEIIEETNSFILLDLNNIYVSAFNHGFDPLEYLEGIPKDRVKQFHLAGHSHQGDHLIDTHGAPIIESVWDLYAKAVQRFGNLPTLIERDDNIPPLEELMLELNKTKTIAQLQNSSNLSKEHVCAAIL